MHFDFAGATAFVAGLVVLVGAITTAAVTILKAIHDLKATAVTTAQASAEFHAQQTEQTAAIASTVGAPVTVTPPPIPVTIVSPPTA